MKEYRLNQDGKDMRMGQDLGRTRMERDKRIDHDFDQFIAGKSPLLKVLLHTAAIYKT
ncbi:hypothetical protein [Sphingobacterium sp.]|uniref:hypothetical protein n=1 Tax=Sphingobacterium sp. TaxID=341027 RepID=UPI0028AD7271|nr:hypothetical protein [Sphingobacterium sp.]